MFWLRWLLPLSFAAILACGSSGEGGDAGVPRADAGVAADAAEWVDATAHADASVHADATAEADASVAEDAALAQDASASDVGPSVDTGPRADVGAVEVVLKTEGEWIAVKVGSEALTQVTADANREVRFGTAANEPYLIIEHATAGATAYTAVTCATANEATRWLGLRSPQTHRFAGALTGLSEGETANISIGGRARLGLNAVGNTFDLAGVAAGTRDFVAQMYAGGDAPSKLKIVRGILVDRDLSGQQIDVTTATIGVTTHRLSSTAGNAFARFFTKNGTGIAGLGDTTGPDEWYALDRGLVEGDQYSFIAKDDNDLRQFIMRNVAATSTPTDQSFDLASVVQLTGVTSSNTLPLELRGLTYVPDASSPPLGAYLVWMNEAGPDREWLVLLTAGCLAGATTYRMPDPSGVSGWSAGWSFSHGTMYWTVTAIMPNVSQQVLAEVPGFELVPGLELHMSEQRGMAVP